MARKVMVNGLDIGYIPPTVASDVAYSNTTSGLASTTVQGAIDEISQTASPSSSLDNRINIKSNHTTFNTAYEFPSDGYVYAECPYIYESAESGYTITIFGSNATSSNYSQKSLQLQFGALISGVTVSSGGTIMITDRQSLYVRKGMKAIVTTSGSASVYFVPFV